MEMRYFRGIQSIGVKEIVEERGENRIEKINKMPAKAAIVRSTPPTINVRR